MLVETKDKLIRDKFKETGLKPIQGLLRHPNGACCALGVLTIEEAVPYDDDLIAGMLNRKYDLSLTASDIKEMILGWINIRVKPLSTNSTWRSRMDQLIKDKVVELIKRRFQETKAKPILLLMKHGENCHCTLGILLKEELDDGRYFNSYPRVTQKLNQKFDLNLTEEDAIWIAMSWDSRLQDRTLHDLYEELNNG